MSATQSEWMPLRERRIALLVATILLPLASFAIAPRWGSWVALLGLGAWMGLYLSIRAWQCPRCSQPFAGGTLVPLNAYCASCGVPQFAPRSLHGPFALRGQEDRRTTERQGSTTAGLSARNRKLVGGAQALAGATVLLVLGTVPGGLIPTSWMELWRVGFAAFALVGGVALYRGDPRGHALTRIVLAAQLLNFVVPGVVWRVQAGFFIGPTVGSGLVDMGAGWNSTFQLWLGATSGWEIKVNLLAFWLLTLIPRGEGAGHGALTALGD